LMHRHNSGSILDMRIAIGANHHGYEVRQMLIDMLGPLGHEVLDLGVCNSRPVDYPDIAAAVAEKVSRGEVERGVLIGGTGMGVCITANKFPGVRAVLCHDDMTAEFSRRHNDSNVLCLSAALLGQQLIRHITELWLRTPFEGGRHARRLEKIAALEGGNG
jgi:ribose 5-phosphate isomerase B